MPFLARAEKGNPSFEVVPSYLAAPLHTCEGEDTERIVSVLIIGLSSAGARNILSYSRHMMQHFLASRDSPIIPLRRSPEEAPEMCRAVVDESRVRRE